MKPIRTANNFTTYSVPFSDFPRQFSIFGGQVISHKSVAFYCICLLYTSDKIDQKPTKLSGGERQRVAIARALVNNPSIILADEPTGSLDSKTGEVILDLLKDLHKKENVTLVMVTHEPYVGNMAERIITVLDGKLSLIHICKLLSL